MHGAVAHPGRLDLGGVHHHGPDEGGVAQEAAIVVQDLCKWERECCTQLLILFGAEVCQHSCIQQHQGWILWGVHACIAPS